MNNMTPTIPSFAFNYWRPWKEGSSVIDSYLDYRKDISLVKYGADTVGKYIQTASKEQVNAINKVGNDIGRGLNILSFLTIENTNQTVNAINNLGSQIENIFSKTNDSLTFINRKIDIQIEQQKISNLLLQNISELLRVPDSEKERQHSIELGLKFFVNAQKDSDLFVDALEELLKAETLMKQDYFVLHRIGCIYLYADKFINPERALEYFKKAAKYSSVESDPSALRLVNVLTSNSNSPNSEINNSIDKLHILTADSYEKAAFSAYILGDYNEAVLNQNKAFKYNPEPKNQFLLAKYQFRNGNISEAAENLDQAISLNHHFFDAVVQLADLDIAGEPASILVLENKINEVQSKLDALIILSKKLKSEKVDQMIVEYGRLVTYASKRNKLFLIDNELSKIEKEKEKLFSSIDLLINRLEKNDFHTFSEDKKSNLIKELNVFKDMPFERMASAFKLLNLKVNSDFQEDQISTLQNQKIEQDYNKLLILINNLVSNINDTVFCSYNNEKINEIKNQLKDVLSIEIDEVEKKKSTLSVIELKTKKMQKIYDKCKSEIDTDKLKVGSRYAGGIVFHIDENGKNGLIVAESDVSEAKEYSLVVNHPEIGRNTIKMKGHANWGGIGIIGTSKIIGSGKNNTRIIVEKASWTSGLFSKKPVQTAARLCSEWNHNGYDDWYLPSFEELKKIFNMGLIKQKANYWSSSENGNDRAYYVKGEWLDGDMPKDRIAHVRAIRSF
jgi:hypothetical protein